MSNDTVDQLLKAFNMQGLLDQKTTSPEEVGRLVTLGKESGIQDSDLPFQLGEKFGKGLSKEFIERCHNMMKGQIVDFAGKKNVSTDMMISIIKNASLLMAGDKPKYDA